MKILLSSIAMLSFASFGQTGADLAPATLLNSNEQIIVNPETYIQNRSVSVTSTSIPCGGGIDTLVASGACSYQWSIDSLGANVVSSMDSLITGVLSNDTTFYLTSFEADLDSLAPMPGHSSTFTGNVRGFYFIAPMDMHITGLYIPQEASTSTQNVSILRFDNQTPPPLWSSTTNAFTDLGTWINYPANDTIFTCLPIDSGDVIGIYGQRGTANSYGNGSSGTVIGGINVPLVRTGMQFSLSTNMHDVWSETTSSISRVQFFYDITPTQNTVPVDVNVPLPEYPMVNMSICDGDSILLEGSYQYTAGNYVDSLFTVEGCDSIITTNLSISALPSVSIASDSACVQDGIVALNGSPVGGTYSGTGVSGASFDPSVGVGSYTIDYLVTDSLGCSNMASGTMVIVDCAAINELQLEGVTIFPNPVNDELHIDLPAKYSEAVVKLYDESGRLIINTKISSGIAVISTTDLSNGMYVLKVSVNKNVNAYKLLKK